MSFATRLLGFLLPGRSRAAAPAATPAAPKPAAADSNAVLGPAAGLTPRDMERLRGVHPDLVRVVIRARAQEPFFVIEGLRTKERQAELVAKGASQTMNSRHLTGHAVDLGPTPLDWSDVGAFRRLAKAVLDAADAEGVPIRWGGEFRDAKGRPWFDGPHFELAREKYP